MPIGTDPPAPGPAPRDALIVEFADLGSVRGVVSASGRDGLVVEFEAHVTARGSTVAGRRWRLAASEDGSRVVARLTESA